MLQLIPGTDFITSGYSAIPRFDNMFGGGNFDATELDDWYVIQRDMQVDGGLLPVRENEVLEVRRQAAEAVAAVFVAFKMPPISEEEIKAAVIAYTSKEMPARDKVADMKAAHWLLRKGPTVVEVIRALAEAGFQKTAANILALQRGRAMGDYLQPAAIFRGDYKVLSALTDPNDYQGPGTGYRLAGERWAAMQDLPQAWDPQKYLDDLGAVSCEPWLEEIGPAQAFGPEEKSEVVVALDPALGVALHRTIGGLDLRQVVEAILQGIAEEGVPARLVRVFHTADCAFLGTSGARLSGSSIAIGLQSKGTTVIQCRLLPPLSNLELFPQAPNLDLATYRQIGRNAARYALRKDTSPVPVKIDNFARLRLIVQTTLLHCRATMLVDPGRPVVELRIKKQERKDD
jgi:hypothetical protein